MEFTIEVDGVIYEISKQVNKVSFKESMNDGCGKLEFTYICNGAVIKNGSVVRFKYKGNNVFYGYVFKVSRSNEKEISVTAYDQLRYCKAKDTVVVEKDTITTLTTKMCNYYNLKMGKSTDTKYILKTNVQENTTWLDIIYSAINETLVYKGEWYVLKDEFGSVCIRDVADMELDLILGDKSLVYGYDYDKSIDDEFYNYIKIVSKNESSKQAEVIVKSDLPSIERYGLLQYFEEMNDSNKSQIGQKAEMLLSLYNKERETLSIKCLGDMRVRSGTSFYALISDIELKKRLIVKSVTHDFIPIHIMSLEVAI